MLQLSTVITCASDEGCEAGTPSEAGASLGMA